MTWIDAASSKQGGDTMTFQGYLICIEFLFFLLLYIGWREQ
jgi:hypothetical protein